MGDVISAAERDDLRRLAGVLELPPPADTLVHAVTRVLTAAVRAGGLVSLELQASQLPVLCTRVVGATAERTGRLELWIENAERCTWHDGLMVVAVAPDSRPVRREVVADALGILEELVVGDRRRAEAELLADHAMDLAGVDAHTQLGNRRTWRRALDDEAARAVRYAAETTVAVIDLDGLKRINDSQGHAAGDAHLLNAARAVKAASRNVDVVCRLGGDEFAVLAPETGALGASRLASRLLHALGEAGVQASIGVATRRDGDLEQAWRDADSDMYEHKRRRALV